MAYAAPIFSSGNPTVDQLFGREFGVRQLEQAAQLESKRDATLRQQIMAQERVAQAQLAGQQQQQREANLFRMSELQDRRDQSAERNRLFGEQVAVEKAYKEGLLKKPGERSATDIEAFNADSETIANQLNALYQNKLSVGEAAAKKTYEDALALPQNTGWWDNMGGGASKKVKAAYDQTLAVLQDKTLNEVNEIAIRYYPQASFKVDTVGKKFLPVRIGGAPSATQPPRDDAAPLVVPVTPAPGPTTQASPVPFNMAPAPTGEPTGPGNPGAWMMNKLGFGPKAAPVAPAAPMIQIPVPDGVIEMSAQDADEMQRQLGSVAPEQRDATAAAIFGQLSKSGRARLIARPPAATAMPAMIPSGYPGF